MIAYYIRYGAKLNKEWLMLTIINCKLKNIICSLKISIADMMEERIFKMKKEEYALKLKED